MILGFLIATNLTLEHGRWPAYSGRNPGKRQLPGSCRARSRAEFTARLAVVEEEADESAYWLEMIIRGELMGANLVTSLLNEANEIVAIMTSSRITIYRKQFADNQNATQVMKSKVKNQKSKIRPCKN